MKNSQDIIFIFKAISSQLFNRVFSPIIKDKDLLKELQTKGCLDQLDVNKVMQIENAIPQYIKSVTTEYGLNLNQKELGAWSDLFSTLITPYNEHLRLECIKCLSPHEVSFINLYSFFNYWSQVQAKLLANGDAAAKAMIRNKLNSFELTSSKPIPKAMRQSLGEYVIEQAKKHLGRKDEEKTYLPDNKVFFIDSSFSFVEQNTLSMALAELFLSSHYAPTARVNVNPKGDEAQNPTNIVSPSIPLLLILNKHKADNYIVDINTIPLKEFPVTEFHYKLSCVITLSSIITLMMSRINKKSQNDVDGSLSWLLYIGFLDEISILSLYGFSVSFDEDSQDSEGYIKYVAQNIACGGLEAKEKLFRELVANVYKFFMISKTNTLFSFPKFSEDDAYEFMRIDINKIARILGLDVNVDQLIKTLKADSLEKGITVND